jgi:hypothetical protein
VRAQRGAPLRSLSSHVYLYQPSPITLATPFAFLNPSWPTILHVGPAQPVVHVQRWRTRIEDPLPKLLVSREGPRFTSEASRPPPVSVQFG